jgi:hypothetical protein
MISLPVFEVQLEDSVNNQVDEKKEEQIPD